MIVAWDGYVYHKECRGRGNPILDGLLRGSSCSKELQCIDCEQAVPWTNLARVVLRRLERENALASL